ncbi:MAG: hypothetical protein M1818_004082 [Claussenomyces sp. TS43310]|nr:MAG: hypothetical protein M1818_004082 [Claussenomyces sp. TS43310]
MLPPLPILSDYGISPQYGFLPSELPLERLPDPYYHKWEAIVANLQGLILSRRLRGVIERLPVLSTIGLEHDAEWRRAYMLLAFMAHSYIWGGNKPAERVPSSISIPFLHISVHLEVPPVATYAAVCLWNFKPLFIDEHVDNFENLSTLTTFTGSLDESWFYLTSVAIEARGAPILPLMLAAMAAARRNDAATVISCLRTFAERLDDLGVLLERIHENCDPHVFYHHIRPFLAGSKNMAEAGLPNGVIYDDGTGIDKYTHYSGGSNAQSSLIQFFDIILGVQHRPTGHTKDQASQKGLEGTAPPPKHNFLHEMRNYMPGPHRRFLEDVTRCANIRDFVESRTENHELSLAYDACLAMLRCFRDKHINVVSRYVVIKSREASARSRAEGTQFKLNIATSSQQDPYGADKKILKGTGGTSLIPFLKQARDETSEPSLEPWTKKILSKENKSSGKGEFFLGKTDDWAIGNLEAHGVVGTWPEEIGGGGLCHY